MKISREYELIARSGDMIIVVDEGIKGIRVFELAKGQKSNISTIKKGFEKLEDVQQKYNITTWVKDDSYAGMYEYYEKIV